MHRQVSASYDYSINGGAPMVDIVAHVARVGRGWRSPRSASVFALVLAAAFLLLPTGAEAAPADDSETAATLGERAPTSQPAGGGQPAQEIDTAELQRALDADASQQKRSPSGAGTDAASAGSSTAPLGTATPAPPSGLTRAWNRTLQSFNPDMSIIADVALGVFSTDHPLMSGGHDPQRTGFTLQQLEMALAATVDPYFRFDSNIVFAEFGVEIEEMYGTTLALPWNLQLRAGQFLTRFGRLNPTHPHTWFFADQVLVLGKFFGSEGNRGLGAELSCLLPLPWYVELIGSVTDAAGEEAARSFFGADDLGVRGPLDFQLTGAIKQFFPLSDDWSLLWGLSVADGPNSTGRHNRTSIFGTDVYLKYRPTSFGSWQIISLEAEWMLRLRQVPERLLRDHGLYSQLFYRFARRWAAAARYELVSAVQDDPLDPEWTDPRQRVSGNLTFWPTEFSRVRLQYNYDHPAWRDPYHAVFLTLELVVGTHGAHRF